MFADPSLPFGGGGCIRGRVNDEGEKGCPQDRRGRGGAAQRPWGRRRSVDQDKHPLADALDRSRADDPLKLGVDTSRNEPERELTQSRQVVSVKKRSSATRVRSGGYTFPWRIRWRRA